MKKKEKNTTGIDAANFIAMKIFEFHHMRLPGQSLRPKQTVQVMH